MPKKILLVDDDKILHKIVTRILSPRYEIVEAFDGVEALEKFLKEKPDLVLLDIMMPKKDGRETIQELKKEPGCATVPVILLTVNGEVMDKLAGFELGADDYITKPFTATVLLERVEKLLKKTR